MEPRLSEMVELYAQLGLEVITEPTTLDDLPQRACRDCFLVQLNRFFTIYTRSKSDDDSKERRDSCKAQSRDRLR